MIGPPEPGNPHSAARSGAGRGTNQAVLLTGLSHPSLVTRTALPDARIRADPPGTEWIRNDFDDAPGQTAAPQTPLEH